TTGYMASAGLQAALARALKPGAQPVEALAFDGATTGFGDLYIIVPISGPGKPAGVLVEEINAAKIFGPYVQSGPSGNLILSGPFVIGPDSAKYFASQQVAVTTLAGIDQYKSLYGALKPTLASYNDLSGD